MHTEITYVPKDKCPLDVLAEMGAETSEAWIYLHKNVIEKLAKSADYHFSTYVGFFELRWEEDRYEKKYLLYEETGHTWHKVRIIIASNIAFRNLSLDPKHIFFLKMAE